MLHAVPHVSTLKTHEAPLRKPAKEHDSLWPPEKLLYEFIASMECLPAATLPEGPEWSYEIKLYRLATGVWTWNFAGENMR